MVGIVNVDYLRLVLKLGSLLKTTAYTAAGLAAGVASGRISYTFALTGPAGSVDTACSSSLVALHAGLSFVNNAESEDALSSGVNLTLSPMTTMLFNRSGMMAADGRCKTMDSAADGYVRSEGIAMVRLQGQVAHVGSNRVTLANIAASVVNQDGQSSSLTAPSGPSQMAALSRG